MNIIISPSSRKYLLAAALLVSVAGLFYTRWRSQTGVARPPASANVSEKTRFYLDRIKSEPTDEQAYLELGKLEESEEFYISSLRRLYTARALGVPDREIVLPLGRDLSRLARWDEAEAELKKATQLMPDSVEAAANLAGVYYSSGDAARASEVLTEFVRRHRSLDNHLKLSLPELRRIMLCFAEAKDTQRAAEIAKEIILVAPDDPGAYSIAGHALVVEDHYAEALPYFKKALPLAPNEAALVYNYGLCLEHTGREDEAIRQFQKCVVLNPNATDAFIDLALLYEKRKDWKMAAVALSNAALHSKSNYRVLYRAAKMNERAGNVNEANYWYSMAALSAVRNEEALAYSKKLMQSADPRWRSSGFDNAAQAYIGMHKVKEYLDTIKQSVRGDTAQDNLRLAVAYEKADLLDKQVQHLKRALDKEPRLASYIHYTLSQTLVRRGLRDEAEKELEMATAADPNNADYHTQLGSLYFERRLTGDRLKRAISEFQQAVRLDPKEASGYQNLGIAYSAAEDYGHAAFYLEHAIDLQPGYGPSYQELGRVYARMGDKEASDRMLALFRKYVRYDLRLKTMIARADQNKKDVRAQTDLADFMVKTGDFASALDRYAAALRIKPQDRDIQNKYDRVVEMITQKKTTQTAKH